ncbi:MAG TPA: lipase maturation factor family protein [Bryobacteraceae bacterium]|nr:lipase maturation factor family protein [Bryobacteraceae bacterium]
MPSSKPLLIYDGKCGFCGLWLKYWRELTGDRIEYAPSQEVGEQYPQIPKAEFSKSVQLVRPDGSVANGARAVFEALGREKYYLPWPFEWGYALIARHRDFFYHATKWTFGTDIQPARFARTQWIFVRLLAAIYAIAFASLSEQVKGLLGAHGILPVSRYLQAVAEAAGSMRFWDVPTVFWMNASDGALQGVCYAGIAVALLVLMGFFERIGLAILFVLYLSLSSTGQEFLSFQWDSLLLETGFLAIFLGRSRIIVWTFRWLLFRLIFSSGAVKLLSHDKSWRDLSALSFHYWTQPLPNRIAWYMAQAPEWFQKFSTGWALGIELAVPFLIFAPRRCRMFGAWCLILLQVLIFLTGNFAFFNLLTLALCVFLFEDRDFERWFKPRASEAAGRLARRVAGAVAMLVLTLGVLRGVEMLTGESFALVRYTAPFQIVNSYGLFAVMTTMRPEIVIEGSMDGETWTPYPFRYKPGDLSKAPRWVEPHQPRLDWQMWFAAMGNYRENPWFVSFAVRLLEGSAEVRDLLDADPFHGRAPQYVRAEVYDYSFTTAEERHRTGNWWKREAKGMYLPPVGLKVTSGLQRP